MLFYTLKAITGGKIISFHSDNEITHLLTDSRKVTVAPGALFFAIKGDHHDGHQYVEDLYKQGIRQFVVETDSINIKNLSEANVIVVASAIKALQAIAAHHRSGFHAPVIGITGSNGKTIIKEWLYQLLSPDFKIAKNPGSYNSQIGVPLSVWQLQPHHDLGIFEAGISKPDEMKNLARIIQPTLGIFTNIGSAHDEGFKSRKDKIQEKLELFDSCELVFCCSDHVAIMEAIQAKKKKIYSWGFQKGGDVTVDKFDHRFKVSTYEKSFHIQLPFDDAASIENCFHCIVVLIHFGFTADQIQQKIWMLKSVPMRLELKEGINQCQIIDDTYNNDLGGLQISLDFLANQHQKKTKRVILSDILESGLPEDELASGIARMILNAGVHQFIGIGQVLQSHQKYFGDRAVFFPTTDAFLQNFDFSELHQEAILIKGARIFQFEKIVNRLQLKVHGTVMEIDLGAVVHNLNFFKSLLKPATKIMVMVKAFAYGSGSTEIANLLQYHKVDYLGVAYADEGMALRNNNIALPIMVMNPSEESFHALLQYNLEPEIYNFKIFHSFIQFLNQQPCSVHIKLDTGMHRLGFEEHEVDALIDLLLQNPHIRVASIFSHLAGADEAAHDEFSLQQGERFKKLADKISAALSYKPLYHILNSPGILRHPSLQFNMVRLGIGLYGIDPTHDGFETLKPVATLKTIISQIKNIPQGETIGYGRRGKADKPMKLATIAIGYADGFTRAFSRGVGRVMINGKLAPVIGNVCMDMTMVDITDIPAQEGDEVIVFGKELPIQELAESVNTIPYELLTSTSERVKRVFVAESI